MEADWAAEVGPDLPRVDVPWAGYVDLRYTPGALMTTPEAVRSPALLTALGKLNGASSPVFTAKCDLWDLKPSEIDRYEFDADLEDTACGHASYIDVLQRDMKSLVSYPFHESWATSRVAELKKMDLPNGRIDLVIRPATAWGNDGYSVTIYVAGCGRDRAAAQRNWREVLAAAVLVTIK